MSRGPCTQQLASLLTAGWEGGGQPHYVLKRIMHVGGESVVLELEGLLPDNGDRAYLVCVDVLDNVALYVAEGGGGEGRHLNLAGELMRLKAWALDQVQPEVAGSIDPPGLDECAVPSIEAWVRVKKTEDES